MSTTKDRLAEPGSTVDTEEQRKAIRILDLTILPVMAVFYLLSFLDRTKMGNARVAGLQKDLGINDKQYALAIIALQVPFILVELSSNLLLRKVAPQLLMPSILTIWGIIVVLHGFVTSYPGLIIVRAILGVMEGPMVPGIVLYLSGFYTRRELAFRIAIFLSSGSLAGAFSGLLAAAIQNMDGIGGKSGWRWIYILEGIFSTLVGILGFYLVPNTPDDLKYLSARQKWLIVSRLQQDQPTHLNDHDHFSLQQIIASICSPHVICVFFMFYMTGTHVFGLALFLPFMVHQLGFSSIKSQLLSVGPFVGGFIVTLFSAFWSDWYNIRAIPIMITYSFAVVGYLMYFATDVKYGSLYLIAAGVFGTSPVLFAWMGNNSEPHYRRATSGRLGFIALNVGGITSTWIYPSNEAPSFKKATVINLVFAVLIILSAGLNALLLHRANSLKEKKREELLAPYIGAQIGNGEDQGKTEKYEMSKAWNELGDRHPDFLYTI
ncbi:hypothetical protein D9758_010304 [Tetrapyrgos nigripes]|uniref:Major facilitator superfamily (MFS) profile domain-containing protein n=1 Tax=Tetrapyrgos nigripes TaxID=182062 RepID=A0A8H5LL38_9AGAR|nr:hypothetical protein D9758_010304 [Tetrapyrgos nigripes]